MSNPSILEPVENIMDKNGLADFLAQTWSEPQGQKLFEAHMERETLASHTAWCQGCAACTPVFYEEEI